MRLFNDKSNQIFSSTDLAKVLEDAVLPDTVISASDKTHRPETILVITDGVPDNRKAVVDVIVKATKAITRDEDLSITFIQVGDDSSAAKWLDELDNNLEGAQFDIVDVMSHAALKSSNFTEIIKKSLQD